MKKKTLSILSILIILTSLVACKGKQAVRNSVEDNC